MYTSVVTSRSAGQIFFFYTQLLLVACVMVANLVWAESKMTAVPGSRPCTRVGLQVVTQFTHDFEGLFRTVDIEPPDLRSWDSIENRDSHNAMSLGRYDTVQNLIKPIKPSRTSNKSGCFFSPAQNLVLYNSSLLPINNFLITLEPLVLYHTN